MSKHLCLGSVPRGEHSIVCSEPQRYRRRHADS